MGNVCGEEGQLETFVSSLQYYGEVTTKEGKMELYKHADLFIYKNIQYFLNKHEMLQSANLYYQFKISPSALQTIYHLQSSKDIKFSSNYCIVTYLQHYTYTLSEYFDSHRVKGTKLVLGEILYILKTLAELGAFLQNKRLYFKSLDPKQIYIDSSYSIKVKIKNITDSQNSKEFLLISPEELNYHKSSTHHKSRVFSLGMLIMQCITLLDSVVTYYDYGNNHIKMQELNQQVKGIKYGVLRCILSHMLQKETSRRVTFKQIYHSLEEVKDLQIESALLID